MFHPDVGDSGPSAIGPDQTIVPIVIVPVIQPARNRKVGELDVASVAGQSDPSKIVPIKGRVAHESGVPHASTPNDPAGRKIDGVRDFVITGWNPHVQICVNAILQAGGAVVDSVAVCAVARDGSETAGLTYGGRDTLPRQPLQ